LFIGMGEGYNTRNGVSTRLEERHNQWRKRGDYVLFLFFLAACLSPSWPLRLPLPLLLLFFPSFARATSSLSVTREYLALRDGPRRFGFISTLRANLFPKVTGLFCRLPLSALFYRPEAIHLRDLLRLWVRLSEKIILSLRFSWVIQSAPDI